MTKYMNECWLLKLVLSLSQMCYGE